MMPCSWCCHRQRVLGKSGFDEYEAIFLHLWSDDLKDFFIICILGCLLAFSLGALFSGSIFIALATIAIQIFLVKKIMKAPLVISNKQNAGEKVFTFEKASVGTINIEKSGKYIAKASVSSIDIEPSDKHIAKESRAPLVIFNKVRIVGVSFDNEDGSSRQFILSGLRCNDEVKIKRNPSAEYPARISVYTSDLRCIGALSAEMSNLLQYFNFDYAVGRFNGSGKGKMDCFGAR